MFKVKLQYSIKKNKKKKRKKIDKNIDAKIRNKNSNRIESIQHIKVFSLLKNALELGNPRASNPYQRQRTVEQQFFPPRWSPFPITLVSSCAPNKILDCVRKKRACTGAHTGVEGGQKTERREKEKKQERKRENKNKRERGSNTQLALANKERMLAFPEETGRTRGDFEHTPSFFPFFPLVLFSSLSLSFFSLNQEWRPAPRVSGTRGWPRGCVCNVHLSTVLSSSLASRIRLYLPGVCVFPGRCVSLVSGLIAGHAAVENVFIMRSGLAWTYTSTGIVDESRRYREGLVLFHPPPLSLSLSLCLPSRA